MLYVTIVHFVYCIVLNCAFNIDMILDSERAPVYACRPTSEKHIFTYLMDILSAVLHQRA